MKIPFKIYDIALFADVNKITGEFSTTYADRFYSSTSLPALIKKIKANVPNANCVGLNLQTLQIEKLSYTKNSWSNRFYHPDNTNKTLYVVCPLRFGASVSNQLIAFLNSEKRKIMNRTLPIELVPYLAFEEKDKEKLEELLPLFRKVYKEILEKLEKTSSEINHLINKIPKDE